MIIDMDTPQVSEVIEIMEEHFPHLVDTRAQRINTRSMPDCSEPDAWCTANIGFSGRIVHHLSGDTQEFLSIDTKALWCRTWGHYGFKNPDDAFAFKLVFG